jgi:hypothetical protein
MRAMIADLGSTYQGAILPLGEEPKDERIGAISTNNDVGGSGGILFRPVYQGVRVVVSSNRAASGRREKGAS